MTARHRRSRIGRLRGQRGAAAVEFALVVPLLLVFVFGIVSISRAFQVQGTISAAAREAARSMALNNDPTAAQAAAVFAASTSSVTLTNSQVAVSPSTCTGQLPTTDVTVTITYQFQPMGNFAGGAGFPITSTAVVRCGG